jgi:hypothetical protein
MNGESATYRECVADHQACGGAAKPNNSISNLVRATKSANGYVFQHRVKGVSLTCGHNLVGHRRMNDAWTDGIDTNPLCGIFQSCAFGETDYSMLGGVICSTTGRVLQSKSN